MSKFSMLTHAAAHLWGGPQKVRKPQTVGGPHRFNNITTGSLFFLHPGMRDRCFSLSLSFLLSFSRSKGWEEETLWE